MNSWSVLFLVLLVFSAQAGVKPEVEWNVLIGGERRDEAWCVKETGDSGFFLAGVTWSYGSGGSDIFLVKTDSTGMVQWNTTIGGVGDDFGSTMSLATSGYLVGGYVTVSGIGKQPFVLMVDEIGQQRWNYTYSDASGSVESITKREDEYIVACSSLSESQVFFLRLDSEGVLLGVEPVDLLGPVNAVEPADGGFIITGTLATEQNGFDTYLAYVNQDYGIEWVSAIGGSLNEVSFSVDQLDEGYLVCGYQVSPQGDYDLYMAKTDENGEEASSMILGDSQSQWAYHGVDVGDRFLVTGMITSEIQEQSGFYLLQTDNMLNKEWEHAFGLGTGTYCDFTSDGGIIVTGTSLYGGHGGKDIRLVKIGPEQGVGYNSLFLVLLVMVLITVIRRKAWSRLK